MVCLKIKTKKKKQTIKFFVFSGKCKVEIKTSKCENSECPTVYENELVDPEFNFDIRVNVTDHRGTLMNCRLSGHAAEETLGCTVSFYLV